MPYGEARGLQCPACRIGSTRAAKTGRANDQSIFLRWRKCDNEECGFTGHTFEPWYEGATIEQMDEDIRFSRMMREREKRGYHGIQSGHPTHVMRFGRISYTVVARQPNGGNTNTTYRLVTDWVYRFFARRLTSKLNGQFVNVHHLQDSSEEKVA